MADKAIGFIDGNNFYHNAKRNNLAYDKADFSRIIKFACKREGWEYGGFYYYNSAPRIDDNKEAYYKQMAYFDRVRKMEGNLGVITRKLRYSSANELLEKYRRRQEVLNALNLCGNCRPKVEPACFNCVMEKSRREKGIDVAIAIDIIQKALLGEYAVCILFSGDADFVPALQLIQKHKKKAFSLFMHCKGYSWELRQNTNYFAIMKDEFSQFLLSP
ncbi:MAG: NYN domain-containing protein [Candidatus Diapherotrites archaeon]